MLLDVINKIERYLAVCSVDLWGNFNFAHTYNTDSEFNSIFRLLRSCSLAECGSKFVHRDDGHQISWHHQMLNSTSETSESE